MRSQLVILLLAFNLPSATAEDFSWPGGGSVFGSAAQSLEEYSYTPGGLPVEDINPDADVRKRLVVEWGKVSRGYAIYEFSDPEKIRYRWIWKEDDSISKGHSLAIRGRLLIESADGKTRRPIDWVQGIRVIVSRKPDQTYDWSSRHEIHEAVWGDFVIWEKGEFLAILAPGTLNLTVGQEEQFQAALSLAEKKGKDITWTNTVGVLPQSVTKLKIPGPPKISETMQMINGAPSYDQDDFNPAKLVRAVNHLLPMGKEKALRELREFLKIAHQRGQTVRVDENIDTSDRTCVYLIVRLLFESKDPNQELPDILTWPFVPAPDEQDKKLWPLHPLYLQDDVPFFLRYKGGCDEEPDQPEQHLDWAEKHGKIRTKPLRPLDNPMIAAERLASLPQTKRLYFSEYDPNFDFQGLLLQQAWNLIEDADPSVPKPVPVRFKRTWKKPDWNARRKAAARLNIHWSEAEQKYVIE